MTRPLRKSHRDICDDGPGDGPPRTALSSLGKARGVVVAMLAGYFVLLWGLGGYGAWGRLGVPTKGIPTFYDTRSVTSAWECERKGIDPLPADPCDSLQRPANFPRIWLTLSPLGLGDRDATALGLLVDAVFVLGVLALVPARASFPDAVLYGLALWSPAVMLGLARANVDLLLFTLVALGVMLLRRGHRGAIVGSAVVFFSAVLKLFPILAVGAIMRQRRRVALLASSAVILLFLLYVALTLDDVRTIRRVTPQTNGYSYGIRVLGSWIASHATWLSAHAWDIALLGAAVALAIGIGRRIPPRIGVAPATSGEARDLDLFWAGAGIYVGMYAIARSFDYRLVFVLLAFPQVLRWLRTRTVGAPALLAAMYATLWLPASWDGLPLWLAAIPQFLLFGLFVATLTATAPVGVMRVWRVAADAARPPG